MRLFDPSPELHLSPAGAGAADQPAEFVETFTFEYSADDLCFPVSREGNVSDHAAESGETRGCEVVNYDAFGNRINDEALTAGDSEHAEQHCWQISGDPVASEEAFYQDAARCYDPTTGRWLDESPLGFDAGDSNLYRFCVPGQ